MGLSFFIQNLIAALNTLESCFSQFDSIYFIAHRAEFTKITRPRSLNQNAYLWLCLAIAEEQTGTDKNWFYKYYLEKFPTRGVFEIFGEDKVIPLTSSQFDSKQMTRFIDNVRLDLSENGIPTPDADDRRLEEIFHDMHKRGLL